MHCKSCYSGYITYLLPLPLHRMLSHMHNIHEQPYRLSFLTTGIVQGGLHATLHAFIWRTPACFIEALMMTSCLQVVLAQLFYHTFCRCADGMWQNLQRSQAERLPAECHWRMPYMAALGVEAL